MTLERRARVFYSGEVTITPPLTVAELRRAPAGVTRWLRAVHGDDDKTKVTATEFRAPYEFGEGGTLADDLRALVAAFGDHHGFAGHIDVAYDPTDYLPTETNLARLVIDGRTVVEITPDIVWPEDDPARVLVDELDAVRAECEGYRGDAGEARGQVRELCASLAAVLRIVADWCTEANSTGGIDAGDLARRLREAGHLLPDNDTTPTTEGD